MLPKSTAYLMELQLMTKLFVKGDQHRATQENFVVPLKGSYLLL